LADHRPVYLLPLAATTHGEGEEVTSMVNAMIPIACAEAQARGLSVRSCIEALLMVAEVLVTGIRETSDTEAYLTLETCLNVSRPAAREAVEKKNG